MNRNNYSNLNETYVMSNESKFDNYNNLKSHLKCPQQEQIKENFGSFSIRAAVRGPPYGSGGCSSNCNCSQYPYCENKLKDGIN